jgi:hypothetical protein
LNPQGTPVKNFIVVISIALIGLADAVADPEVFYTEISLEQATRQLISNDSVSRVLAAKTSDVDGRIVHIIKILTKDGHIQLQTIAADTGELLDMDSN